MKKISFIKYLWSGGLTALLAVTILVCVVMPIYWSTTVLGISTDGPIAWALFGVVWTLIIVVNYFKWKKER